MSVLDRICAKKAEHVAAQKSKISLNELKSRIKDQEPPRGFINALKQGETPAIIAEIKKASPSKGLIRSDFDPAQIARTYEDNGAVCISVLTDEPYFQGCDSYFSTVKKAASLPLLRKDFMIDSYQIYESRALGADCILIIMAALSDSKALELYNIACELGMDVLVEIHNAQELKRAAILSPAMIGVNNRNLKTLDVDIQTSFDLLSHISKNVFKIAESGITKADTISKLSSAGYQGFLVGESLMRHNNIGKALKNLRQIS